MAPPNGGAFLLVYGPRGMAFYAKDSLALCRYLFGTFTGRVILAILIIWAYWLA